MHWTWILVLAAVTGAGAGVMWFLAGSRDLSEDQLDSFDFDRAKNRSLLRGDPYADGPETKRSMG